MVIPVYAFAKNGVSKPSAKKKRANLCLLLCLKLLKLSLLKIKVKVY
jgi:hypothetical protein